MKLTKEELLLEKLDNLIGSLTRLNPTFGLNKEGDEIAYMESNIEGKYVQLNELEEKIENLKKEILGE